MFGGHFVFSSGLLDHEEFHRIMKKVQGRFRQHTADDATQRFRKMGQTSLNKVLTLEETDFLFALIDTDGSGTISVKEFAGFLKESERNKGEHWVNALDLARQQDLVENEQRRRRFIAQRESIGQARRWVFSTTVCHGCFSDTVSCSSCADCVLVPIVFFVFFLCR